jgi:hypothetical protein
MPRFKVTPADVKPLATWLAALQPSKDDTVVLDLLPNSAVLGTDVEGLPSPSLLGVDGTYHKVCLLTVAQTLTVKKKS